MSAVSHVPPIAPEVPNRRALILPGGGMRVAWQAGVVQRLHESGLRFSYADGTSGGLMNLAALLSGIAPAELALRWRSLNPARFISPVGLRAWFRFPNLPAFGDFDGIRAHVYPHLGIDIDRLRVAEGVTAQFNICDFGAKAVVPVPHRDIGEALLLAGMSLPIFTPAVEHDGRTWTDAVWIQDSNLLACVQAGANEVWIAWCIGDTPRFLDGVLNQYVHMIEMSAIGALNDELAEVAALNAQIAAGERPFGHDAPIRVRLIRPELPIPLDPDYVAGLVSGDALVDQGYMDAARFLDAGAPEVGPAPTQTSPPAPGVAFRERMAGRISFSTDDPTTGWADVNAVPVVLNATIDIRDIAGFVADPQHRAGMAAHLSSPMLGFTLPATATNFQLFAPSDRPDCTEMVYELGIVRDGRPFWFSGRKFVRRGGPWRLWRDTTTLHVRLYEGDDRRGKVVAAGVLRLAMIDFLALGLTLHARDALGLRARMRAKMRFVEFFAASLWRTYGPEGWR